MLLLLSTSVSLLDSKYTPLGLLQTCRLVSSQPACILSQQLHVKTGKGKLHHRWRTRCGQWLTPFTSLHTFYCHLFSLWITESYATDRLHPNLQMLFVTMLNLCPLKDWRHSLYSGLLYASRQQNSLTCVYLLTRGVAYCVLGGVPILCMRQNLFIYKLV